MKRYQYCVLDVFTNERYKGNPLAVVFTESDLALASYEKMSREFGYSETSFIYYSMPDKALKVRSFTATGIEINGAGHNLLGAVSAAVLTGMDIFHEQEGKQFVIMKDEVITLSLEHTDNNSPFVGMLQKPAVIETFIDPKMIAKALGLSPDEIYIEDLLPAVVKTEVAHLMVPLRDPTILNKAVANKSLLITLSEEYHFEGVYCFAILQEDPQYFAEARFFNPGIGIDEDPATGSAAGPLAGFLLRKRYIQRNVIYQILQGVKMNQPSILKFEVKTEGIWVSGSSIIVMEGNIYE